MIYNFFLELEWLYRQENLPANVLMPHKRPDLDRDYTADDPPKLPIVWKLTDEEDRVYVNGQSAMDYTWMSEPPDAKVVAANNSINSTVPEAGWWRWYADATDKPGIIATTVGAHISFNATIGATSRVTIGFLSSYKTIGQAAVWVDNNPDVTKATRAICSGLNKLAVIDAKWTLQYSVYISAPVNVYLVAPVTTTFMCVSQGWDIRNSNFWMLVRSNTQYHFCEE